jgi:hypothetical protein
MRAHLCPARENGRFQARPCDADGMNSLPGASDGPGVLITKITLMTSAGNDAWFRWDVITGSGPEPDQALARLRDGARARAESIGREIARDAARMPAPTPAQDSTGAGLGTWQVYVVDVRFAAGSQAGPVTEWLAYGTLASRDSGPLPDVSDPRRYQ